LAELRLEISSIGGFRQNHMNNLTVFGVQPLGCQRKQRQGESSALPNLPK
jgi:hypothetical protein